MASVESGESSDLIEVKSGVDASVAVRECILENASVLPGLPDDIALLCLARVPRKYHTLLKCVSRSWRKLVCREEWQLHRKKHHLDETWIYTLCRDKLDQLCCYALDPNHLKEGWKRLLSLPSHCLKRKGVGFEASGKKLYIFGGCGWVEAATDEAHSYDAVANSWTGAASMPVGRCFFASGVFDEKIYLFGGLGAETLPNSVDIYDTLKNCWTSEIGQHVSAEIEDVVVYDGKMYLKFSSSAGTQSVHSATYEPSSGIWQQADATLTLGWGGPAVVANGILYVLDQTSGTKLMMWRKDVRDWEAIGRLSSTLTRPPCRLVAIGENVFIIGKGLSTVVLNVGDVSPTDGILVSKSIGEISCVDDVITCRCLAI